jgi:hypothetical protein
VDLIGIEPMTSSMMKMGVSADSPSASRKMSRLPLFALLAASD